ncbi:MAG: iron-sulfur cluster assembly accessory protein [Gammaproteobacteria bacterium]|nr:iron-sulfur cluster assembly accessory protein [Gammaproteobacteria bacterium]
MEYSTSLTSDDIRVSPDAGVQLQRLLSEIDDDDIEAIRIYVAGGGCSGMTYGMMFTDRFGDYDLVYDADGYRICVDAVALNYLRGVEIDFVTRETGSTFVFNNVFQATGGAGTCGACGMAGGGCS